MSAQVTVNYKLRLSQLAMVDVTRLQPAHRGYYKCGSGLGRDIALGLTATDFRAFSAVVSSAVSLDFTHASGDAITLGRFDMACEVETGH